MGSQAVASPSSPRKSPSSSLRRVNKPLVEKKRRARINGCLGKLKELILTATKTEDANVSRLEKADILEMTVNYLRHKQNQNGSADIKQEPEVAAKFQDGYTECAAQVFRYMSSFDGLTSDVRSQLEGHLVGRLRESASTSVPPAVNPINPATMVGQSTQNSENLSNVNELTAHYQTAVDLANMASMPTAPNNRIPMQKGFEKLGCPNNNVPMRDDRPENQYSTSLGGNHMIIDPSSTATRTQYANTTTDCIRNIPTPEHVNDSSMSSFCSNSSNQGHYNKNNNIVDATNIKHSSSGYEIPEYHKPLYIDIPESPPLSMSPSPPQLQRTYSRQSSQGQSPPEFQPTYSRQSSQEQFPETFSSPATSGYRCSYQNNNQDEVSILYSTQESERLQTSSEWRTESSQSADNLPHVTETPNSYNLNYSRTNQCMMYSNVTNSHMQPTGCYSSNMQYRQGNMTSHNMTSHNMYHLPPTPSPPTLIREDVPYVHIQSQYVSTETQRNPLTCLQNYCNSEPLRTQTNMPQSVNNISFEQHNQKQNCNNSHFQPTQTKSSLSTSPVSISCKSSYSLHPNSHEHLHQQHTQETNFFDQRVIAFKEQGIPGIISTSAHTSTRGEVPITDKTNNDFLNDMRMNDQRTSAADSSYSRTNNPLSPPTLKKRILFGKRSEVTAFDLTETTLARVQAERLGQTGHVTNLNGTKAGLSITKESVLDCNIRPEMAKISSLLSTTSAVQGHTQGKIDEHLWRPW